MNRGWNFPAEKKYSENKIVFSRLHITPIVFRNSRVPIGILCVYMYSCELAQITVQISFLSGIKH